MSSQDQNTVECPLSRNNFFMIGIYYHMMVVIGPKKKIVSCNPNLTSFFSKKSLPQSFFRPPNSKSM